MQITKKKKQIIITSVKNMDVLVSQHVAEVEAIESVPKVIHSPRKASRS